jgi:hypothetical protein
MSAFLQLQAALVAALQAQPALAGVTVTDRPDKTQPESVHSVVLVRLVASDALRPINGCQDWATGFELQAGARATSLQPNAATRAHALLQAVWSAVSALAVPDVINAKADPRIDFAADQLDASYHGATLRLAVTHRTQSNTLQPWST